MLSRNESVEPEHTVLKGKDFSISKAGFQGVSLLVVGALFVGVIA
jgi:hypothetical protein